MGPVIGLGLFFVTRCSSAFFTFSRLLRSKRINRRVRPAASIESCALPPQLPWAR